MCNLLNWPERSCFYGRKSSASLPLVEAEKTPGNQRLPNLSFDLYTKTAFMLIQHVTQLGHKSLSLKNAIIILRAASALTANFLIPIFFLRLS